MRNEDGVFLTYDQVAKRTNTCRSTVIKIARETGSVVKIGRSARVNWETFYRALVDGCTEQHEG